MTDSDVRILEEIISLDGDCLDYNRCSSCPFIAQCLPKFVSLQKHSLTTRYRLDKAMNTLMQDEIFKEGDI